MMVYARYILFIYLVRVYARYILFIDRNTKINELRILNIENKKNYFYCKAGRGFEEVLSGYLQI